jgi:hypothetical protein
MHVVTRWIGIGFVILVLGIILFGTPFAAGFADLISTVFNGLYVFATNLGSESNAVG